MCLKKEEASFSSLVVHYSLVLSLSYTQHFSASHRVLHFAINGDAEKLSELWY